MLIKMKPLSNVIPLLRKSIFIQRNFYIRVHNFSSQGGVSSYKKKADDIFFNTEVQRILKKITGLDYDKVFAPRKTEVKPLKYEFATEKRLKELQDAATARALEKLQMPPVMEVREPINEVMAHDPELQGYLRNKLMFIDISPDISSRVRSMTVRELDGTLRKATWEERDRMNQIFFPISGRELEAPPLFTSPNIERLLEEGSYIFLLDSACIQYEPDNPEYHRVTKAVYEHIEKMQKFDVLRSTRHFGPMAFYFAFNKNIDSLLSDMIEKQLINDASDTIRLLHILHPELENSTKDENNDIKIIQDYIKNHSTNAGDLELRLQTYLELQQQQNLQLEEIVA